MSYRDHLDPHSQKFHHNWTRPKRSKSQVNGHTEVMQRLIGGKGLTCMVCVREGTTP